MLAGGRGARMGGREKGSIRLGGKRLIDTVVEAAIGSGCKKVLIAGDLEADGADTIREQPPYGGPVAGLAAVLPEVGSGWVMLLACDLPRARPLARLLRESFRQPGDHADGLIVLRGGQPQWLAGIYRRDSINRALARVGEPSGASLRSLLGGLKLREVEDPEGWSCDLDTPEELEAFINEGNDHDR